MLKTKIKVISCFVIFLICATIMLANGIGQYNTSYAYFGEFGNSAVFVNQNKNYLVSPKLSSTYAYNTKRELRQKDILNINGIIFTKDDNFEVKLLQNFMKDFGSPMIYVPKGHPAIANLKSTQIAFIEYDDGVILDGNIYICIDNVFGDNLTSIVICDTCFAFAGEDFDITNDSNAYDYLVYNGQMQSDNDKIITDTRYIKLG